MRVVGGGGGPHIGGGGGVTCNNRQGAVWAVSIRDLVCRHGYFGSER